MMSESLRFSLEVSIVVVTFNNEATIERCLDSILKQDSPPGREIIVVDNASTDGTVALIRRRYGDAIKPVQNAQNKGFANGVNVGMHHSRGKIIFLLNPDAELVESNVLWGLCKLIVSNSAIGAVSPSIVSTDGQWMGWGYFPCVRETFFENFLPATLKRQLAPISRFLKVRPPLLRRSAPMWIETGSGGAMMFRRDLAEELGWWDESYFMYLEDVDFCFRLANAGYRNFLAAQYTVKHARMQSSQGRTDRLIWLSRRHYVTHRLFFRKYRKRLAAAVQPFLWYSSHIVRWPASMLFGKKNTELASVCSYWIRTLIHGGEP